MRAPLQKRHRRVHAIENSRQLTVFVKGSGDSADAGFRGSPSATPLAVEAAGLARG